LQKNRRNLIGLAILAIAPGIPVLAVADGPCDAANAYSEWGMTAEAIRAYNTLITKGIDDDCVASGIKQLAESIDRKNAAAQASKRKLAEGYEAAAEYEKAADTYLALLEIDPNDGKAAKGLQRVKGLLEKYVIGRVCGDLAVVSLAERVWTI